jgi:hypothetical protein
MDYVFVHELGHSFGGLADEYYTSQISYVDMYLPSVEPWEPNVTSLALLNDLNDLKWQNLVSPGISIPTPWKKEPYDSLEREHAKLDRLAPDYYVKREPLYRQGQSILKNDPFAGKTGAFEGAGYVSKGMYRPSIDCRMFSLSLTDFCPVCRRSIEQMIDYYSK